MKEVYILSVIRLKDYVTLLNLVYETQEKAIRGKKAVKEVFPPDKHLYEIEKSNVL